MRVYLVKRLLLMIPTLIGITIITFTLIRLAPGDPSAPKVGEGGGGGLDRAAFAREVQEAKKKLLGLDKPIPVQYLNWCARLVTLDLGDSYSKRRPVGELIRESLVNTLRLDLIAIFLAYVIAVPLGIFSATHRYSIWDRLSTVALFILYSLPTFWIASLAIIFLGGGDFLDIFPISWLNCNTPERHFPYTEGLDWLGHFVLPVACLTYPVLAALSRYSRAGMMEVIRQDFIRTARAKGLSEKVVIFKHAARNGMIPILTLLATMLPLMVSGSVIIEYIFSINGMGKLMFDAVMERDYPIVMAVSSLSAVMTLFGVLMSDFLYVFVDPRISFEKLET